MAGRYPGASSITFGDFELDLEQYELRRTGERVPIAPKAFDLLVYLVGHRDRLVTKSEILDALWPEESVTQSSLTSCMLAVRQCLHDDGQAQRFIQTVRGRGYRFSAPLVLEGASGSHGPAGDSPTATRELPATAPRALRRSRLALVGRGEEIDRLMLLLREALAGRGQLATIVGDAGIGKSRLAVELVARAEAAGFRCVRGMGRDCGGTPAFGLWIEAGRTLIEGLDASLLVRLLGTASGDVATLLPEVGERIPDVATAGPFEGEQASYRLLDSMTTFLRNAARQRPTLILLEDLHWADQSSLRLLGFLAPAIGDAPLVVVGTYRDGEIGTEHPLVPVQATLRRQPNSERIELRGLAPGAVDLLARRYGGMPVSREAIAAIARITEGSPLFVLEMLDHLRAEGISIESTNWLQQLGLPEGVREIIGLRIARLSEPCLKLLRRAAVIGEEFAIDVLEAIADAPTDTVLDLLDEAVAARVVGERQTRANHYAFSHALIREVLYQGLNTVRRVRLHQRIAELLEARLATGQSVSLLELAHHFVATGSRELAAKTVDYAVRAADHARSMLAYDEAATLYEAAVSTGVEHGIDDAPLRCALLKAIGDAQVCAGWTKRAHQAFLRSAELAREIGDVTAFAQAALDSGGHHLRRFGTLDEAPVELMEQALELVGDDNPTLRARLLARLALALRHAPDSLQRRIALEDEAVTIATRCGDDATMATVLDDTIWGLWRPSNLRERTERTRWLLDLARALGSIELELRAHGRRVVELMEAGELATAAESLESHGQLTESLRLPLYRWDGLNYRYTFAMLRGRFADARQHCEAAYAAKPYVHPDNAEQIYGVQLGLLRFAEGRGVEHLPVLTNLLDQHPTAWRAALAWLAAELGAVDDARAVYDELARDDFASLPPDSSWLASIAHLSMATRALGDRARAGVLYELLLPYADRFPIISEYGLACHGSARRYLGLLNATMGRWEEATADFEHALARHREIESPPETARTLYDYACMLRDRGRRRDTRPARAMLSEARGIADALGMERLRELAATRLAAR